MHFAFAFAVSVVTAAIVAPPGSSANAAPVIAAPVFTAAAPSATAVVNGDVRDGSSGAPIAGASLTLESAPDATRSPTSAGAPAAGAPTAGATTDSATIFSTATSDRNGAFELAAPAAGRYRLVAAAAGYQTTESSLTIAASTATTIHVVLSRVNALRAIGRTVSRNAAGVPASAERSISQNTMASEGAIRVADALQKLSGVDVSGDALAPGGDAYVSLRGLRPGESQTLLDGHPIGPIGIQANPPDADGSIAGFNYQDAPYFALRDVTVAFGTGAEELGGGAEGLGGSVDLRTFAPTAHPDVFVEQGFGTQGRALSALHATGIAGKLGYALVYGVEGTYGQFPGASIVQTGLRGTDFTSQTLDALTYHVSGDYDLRNALAKLSYAPAPNTNVAFTAYDATSWADKTGEGDNDDNPYAYILANAPVGAAASCPHGVLVTTGAGPDCISPSAYAAAASGPAGGGPNAWQALRNQDYDVRATTLSGNNELALDTFTDEYSFVYHRSASPVSGPLDAFLDRWSTLGARLGDQLTSRSNVFGFGLSWLRQTLGGDGTTTAGAGSAIPTTALIDESAFVRDAFSPDPRVSLLFDARLQRSTLDAVARFDPHLSILYRPTAGDAFRLSAGGGSDEPSLQTDRVDLLPVGALNPDCGAIAAGSASAPATVNVGTGPAPHLAPEQGTDLEFGYDHRFGSDATVSATLYDENVTNLIVSGEFPAGSQLPSAALAPLFARIAGFCGLTPAPGAVVFGLTRSFNAASARLRGLEVAGRVRASSRFAVRYGYDIQSIVLEGLPAIVLRSDPTLVNDFQAFEVPLHKATLGIEYAMAPGATLGLDAHAIGPNNPQQLPGFAYADASLEASVTRHVVLHVAVSNVFDSHAQTYGLVGEGLPYATNSYNAALATPFLQPDNERYGLAPASLTIDATLKL